MIKALPTFYRGYHFRSRLEARWAVFFDCLNIKWEYEIEGYELDGGEWYLPDFWLPRFHYPNGIYVEVKPLGDLFLKAQNFVLSGGGAVLRAEGTPDLQAYRLIEPVHDSNFSDFKLTPCSFYPKYLPGGSHEHEYRMYWWPEPFDGDPLDDIDSAIRACRQMKFEERA
jgi:hypothetical protein